MISSETLLIIGAILLVNGIIGFVVNANLSHIILKLKEKEK